MDRFCDFNLHCFDKTAGLGKKKQTNRQTDRRLYDN